MTFQLHFEVTGAAPLSVFVRQYRRERLLNKTTLQKATAGAALAAALGAGMFEAHQNSKLNKQIQTLQQEQRSFTERIRGLEEELDRTKQHVAALRNKPQAAVRLDTVVRPSPKAANIAALPSVGLEDELDRAYAETSPGSREAALDHISKSILPSDIPRALAHLATRAGVSGVESSLFSELASKWGESDPNAAIAWASGLSDASAQRAALLGVLKGWAQVSPEAAASYAAKLPAGDLQDAGVIKVVKEWSFRDARGAASWVSTFPESKLRDKAVEPIVFGGQGQSPAAIADMLDTIGSADLTKKHGETLASIWLSRDAAAALIWIEHSALPDEAKQRLLRRADEEK
jgi:hypothetical protein